MILVLTGLSRSAGEMDFPRFVIVMHNLCVLTGMEFSHFLDLHRGIRVKSHR